MTGKESFLVRSRPSLISYLSGFLPQMVIAGAVIAAMACSLAASAQESGAYDSRVKSSSSMDVSLGIFGQFTSTRTSIYFYGTPGNSGISQLSQGSTESAGALGTFHQSFRPWLGYNVNFGYTRFSEAFSDGAFQDIPQRSPLTYFHRGTIGANAYELTGSYVVQVRKTRRMDIFAQLGTGVLSFRPTQRSLQFRGMVCPTMVFGTGLNYNLWRNWALRAEYRGLFYKNPDFKTDFVGAPSYYAATTSRNFNITNEPTISVVYRFGKKR